MRSTARAIAASPLPALEELVLWVGASHDDPSISSHAELLEVLRGTFPKLRHLGIRNCGRTDEVVEALVAAPLFPQLRTLDLSLGTLSARGARLLLDARGRAHLETIDIADNLVDRDTVDELDVLGTILGDEAQRGDDHFVPITE